MEGCVSGDEAGCCVGSPGAAVSHGRRDWTGLKDLVGGVDAEVSLGVECQGRDFWEEVTFSVFVGEEVGRKTVRGRWSGKET